MPDFPEKPTIVINTSPLIALIAGIGNLSLLKNLYGEIIVPLEVCDEISVNNKTRFGADIFLSTEGINIIESSIEISPLLLNLLDTGEASVIQTALNRKISLVCIDDAAGRRVARLNGLEVTGTMGILLRAKKSGFMAEIAPVLSRMISKGFRISDELYAEVIRKSGEDI